MADILSLPLDERSAILQPEQEAIVARCTLPSDNRLRVGWLNGFSFITSTGAWKGCRESRRCSRGTYTGSYITEHTLVSEDWFQEGGVMGLGFRRHHGSGDIRSSAKGRAAPLSPEKSPPGTHSPGPRTLHPTPCIFNPKSYVPHGGVWYIGCVPPEQEAIVARYTLASD